MKPENDLNTETVVQLPSGREDRPATWNKGNKGTGNCRPRSPNILVYFHPLDIMLGPFKPGSFVVEALNKATFF